MSNENKYNGICTFAQPNLHVYDTIVPYTLMMHVHVHVHCTCTFVTHTLSLSFFLSLSHLHKLVGICVNVCHSLNIAHYSLYVIFLQAEFDHRGYRCHLLPWFPAYPCQRVCDKLHYWSEVQSNSGRRRATSLLCNFTVFFSLSHGYL